METGRRGDTVIFHYVAISPFKRVSASPCHRVTVSPRHRISRPLNQLELLPNLLTPERPDPIYPKRKDQPVFVSQANIESEILGGDRTAFPAIAERGRGANQGAIGGEGKLLEVEEERHAAEQTMIMITERHTRTPLRAAHRTGFSSQRIRKLTQRWNQLNGTSVIER